MKLTGNLKKKVDEAGTRDAARAAIEDAGMLLTDDELSQVAGGKGDSAHDCCPDGAITMKWNLDHFPSDRRAKHGCPVCGGHLSDQKFWFQDTKKLHNGYMCDNDDSHRWIWGNPI